MWREQLAALPRAARYFLRRLFRREFRYFLTIDDRLAARFTSEEDRLKFEEWLIYMHTVCYGLGIAQQKEVERRAAASRAIAEQSRTP
jgi:hypothetical protein